MANKKIKIGDNVISDSDPVYLIAEIGINHNGDIDLAKKLVDAIHCTNWNCAKFQKRTPEICVPESQKNISRNTPWGEMTYLDYKRKIEFGKMEYDLLHNYCGDKGISLSASVWDLPSLEFMNSYNIPFIKIASASITDLNLIKACAMTKKPIFLSTGMSSLDEIDNAVKILEEYTDGNYILFHTNSSYPSKIDELNLKMIKFLKDRYDCLVGYSGHETGIEPSVMATVLGACVIERHVTIDKNMWGSDHKASLDVAEMYQLQKRIQETRIALGDGIKVITTDELKMKEKLRG